MTTDSGPAPTMTGIREITRADFESAGTLMARAFDDDPVINVMAKQDEKREQRIRRFMDVGLQKLTFPYGETYITETGDGAAYWNPPGGRPHGLLADLSLMPTLVAVAGLGGVPRAISAFSLVDKKHPKAPHYYLLAIGVDPDRQGQGVGSRSLPWQSGWTGRAQLRTWKAARSATYRCTSASASR